MRNKHSFKGEAECRCPKCGEKFNKNVTIEYVTNERGDIIQQRII